MAAKISGGCICGAVRYECAADPVMTANCHCRDCQKAGGGAFAPALAVPAQALKISGEVKYYDTKSDSGHNVSRGFCPNCGARLFGKPSRMPELAVVMAGSLDDPSWYRPGMNLYTDSAQPWVPLDAALPRFANLPPMPA